MTSESSTPANVGSHDGLGPLPEPAGFRTRYRSEPGMIGHYPWTYADQRRRKHDRPECEYQDLFTAEQLRAAVAAERERCAMEVWYTMLEATAEDADDMGLEGWLREAERRVRAGPTAPDPLKTTRSREK